jgi:hypothetical protein
MYISVCAGENLSQPGNGSGRGQGRRGSGTEVHGSSAAVDEAQTRAGDATHGQDETDGPNDGYKKTPCTLRRVLSIYVLQQPPRFL